MVLGIISVPIVSSSITMATTDGPPTALVIWIKAVVSVEKVHLLLEVVHMDIWSKNRKNR